MYDIEHILYTLLVENLPKKCLRPFYDYGTIYE